MVEETVSMKDKITKVLESTGLGSERAGKCSEGDFLKLLHSFREENIYFC
jgi:18S rRNA (adenine1779-N6/adenine1780-N6)-dimethyltransferase